MSQVLYQRDVRVLTLILAVKLGIPESEEQLARLLDLVGDKSMAEDYLNCGSDGLRTVARRWAAKHG